jgi:hypothetical protein
MDDAFHICVLVITRRRVAPPRCGAFADERLTRRKKTPDISIMHVRRLIEGRMGWWKQLADAIGLGRIPGIRFMTPRFGVGHQPHRRAIKPILRFEMTADAKAAIAKFQEVLWELKLSTMRWNATMPGSSRPIPLLPNMRARPWRNGMSRN